jgi:hypothetical protein
MDSPRNDPDDDAVLQKLLEQPSWDHDYKKHDFILRWRYGLLPSNDQFQPDAAAKIAEMVTSNGSQAPTIGMLCRLKASVDDLANGIELASRWMVQYQ